MIDPQQARQLVSAVPKWYHSFEVQPGVHTPGINDPRATLEWLGLPADMAGLTVLDVGTSDGFFAMSAARRGAKVTCIDYREKHAHGFGVMEALTGLEFDYRRMNVYDIGPQLGSFDVVLFMGVLYHLPDMLAGLAKARAVCAGSMFVETECHGLDAEPAAATYHRQDSFAADITNFWVPNPSCVRDMLFDAGFDVKREHRNHSRLLAECAVASDPARGRKLELGYGMYRDP